MQECTNSPLIPLRDHPATLLCPLSAVRTFPFPEDNRCIKECGAMAGYPQEEQFTMVSTNFRQRSSGWHLPAAAVHPVADRFCPEDEYVDPPRVLEGPPWWCTLQTPIRPLFER